MLAGAAARADLDVPQRRRAGRVPAHAGHASATSATCSAGSAQDMRSYGVAGPGHRRRCCSSPCSASARWPSLVDVLAVGLRRPALAGLPMLAIYSVPVAVYVDSVPAAAVRRRRRRLTSGCWSPTTSTGYAGSAAGSPATAATSTSGSPRPLAAAGRRLAVVGVAVAVLLPLAVPGMTGGLLDQLGADRQRHRQRPARAGRQPGPDRPVRLAQRAAQPGPGVRPGQGHHHRAEPVLPALRRRRRAAPERLPGAATRAAGRSTGTCPTRPSGPAPGCEQQPLPGDRRGHQEPRTCRCVPVYADPVRTDGPEQQLALRPEPAGRLLQPGQLPGQEVLLRLRPLDVHARRRCAGRAAAAGRPPDAPQFTRTPAVPEVDELVKPADPGQAHRLRQGPGDLRLLLRGQRLQLPR